MAIPKWIYPKEVRKFRYWFHLAIIVLVVIGGLRYIFNHDMFSIRWFIIFYVLIAVGDITAHSLLKLN